MSGVELRVVLVGDDPEQQAAFNNQVQNERDANERMERHSLSDPTNRQEPIVPGRPVDPPSAPVATPSPETVEPPPRYTDPPQQATPEPQEPRTLLQSIDELIAHIDTLVQVETEGTRRRSRSRDRNETPESARVVGGQSERRSSDQPEHHGALNEFTERMKRVLEHASQVYRDTHFGRTIAGQRLLHTARLAGRGVRGAVNFARRSPRIRAVANKTASAVMKVARKVPVPQRVKNVFAKMGGGASGGAVAGEAGTQAASGAAAAIGPVIAVGVAAAGTALALQQMISAVHHAAEALEDMSPELATVKAEFEAMHELARLDRASRIGQGAAKIEAARNRIAESTYELWTRILEIILKVEPALTGILDGINVGVRSADVGVAQIRVIVEMIRDFLGDRDPQNNKDAEDARNKAMTNLAESLREFFKQEPDQAIDPFLAELLNMPAPRAPRAPAPPPGLNNGFKGGQGGFF